MSLITVFDSPCLLKSWSADPDCGVWFQIVDFEYNADLKPGTDQLKKKSGSGSRGPNIHNPHSGFVSATLVLSGSGYF